MAKTPDMVAKDILAALKISAPGFSLELGTPERKIVDATAEAISECYVDQYLVGSLMDIESKAGIELEQWVGIFGFGRLQGRKASGVIRVELNTANIQDINIPLGSQFYTRQSLPSSGNPLFFTSTQAVVIPSGSFVVDVPAECVEYGVVGNVPPDTIVYVGDVLGATSVTNLQSFTGGVDPETDEELRQRFKNTFLRHVTGTEDWYLGLCYQNDKISRAACFGPVRRYSTQLKVSSGTMNLDPQLLADIKYAWEGSAHVSVFKNLGQQDEKFYKRGVDYGWTPGANPQFARISGGQISVGEVVDLEFEYTTKASRNDPSLGIANKVDVYVNGSDPYSVTERTTVTDTPLTATTTDQHYRGNFVRVGSLGMVGQNAARSGYDDPGHRFTRLGSTPVVSVPSIISVTTTVGGVPTTKNCVQGTDFHLIRSAPENNPNAVTLLAGSQYEIAGIEWMPTSNAPAVGTNITLTYSYNRIPERLQAVINTSKQLTTDVMVHQASNRYVRVYLSVEYNRGFVVQQVNNAINERLKTFFEGMQFGAWVEFSDIILAVHQVLGVDNVRITRSTDDDVEDNSERYGVHVFASSTDLKPASIHDDGGGSGTYLDGVFTANSGGGDFKFRDNQLPVFLDAVIRRTANR